MHVQSWWHAQQHPHAARPSNHTTPPCPRTKVKAAPIAEPIFPPELKTRPLKALTLPGPLATWHRPLTLDALLTLKRAHPDARLITGNTEVGIEMKFKDAKYPVLIAVTHVAEINRIVVGEADVTFGAATTLTQLQTTCNELIASRPAHQTSVCSAIAEQLRWFAGPQIRNAASIGGNVCTASPISDLNPLWVAAGAVFVLQSLDKGAREVAARDFFLGYRCVCWWGCCDHKATHMLLCTPMCVFYNKHNTPCPPFTARSTCSPTRC